MLYKQTYIYHRKLQADRRCVRILMVQLKASKLFTGQVPKTSFFHCCCDTHLHFFCQWVISRWNSLWQEDTDAPSVNSFKNHLQRRCGRQMDFFKDMQSYKSYRLQEWEAYRESTGQRNVFASCSQSATPGKFSGKILSLSASSDTICHQYYVENQHHYHCCHHYQQRYQL